MKLIPILFSTPMVQAVLDGRKTITRRTKGLEYFNKVPYLFKTTNKRIETCRFWDGAKEKCPNPIKTEYIINSSDGHENKVQCPYGQVGDILWVRENYCPTGSNQYLHNETNKPFFYAADIIEKDFAYSVMKDYGWKMKPSIHMPKEACRIFLKITNVRVERLQDISETDAESEGIGKQFSTLFNEWRFKDYYNVKDDWRSAVSSFQSLWASINGVESWDANPWVWVIKFERIERPSNFLSVK